MGGYTVYNLHPTYFCHALLLCIFPRLFCSSAFVHLSKVPVYLEKGEFLSPSCFPKYSVIDNDVLPSDAQIEDPSDGQIEEPSDAQIEHADVPGGRDSLLGVQNPKDGAVSLFTQRYPNGFTAYLHENCGPFTRVASRLMFHQSELQSLIALLELDKAAGFGVPTIGDSPFDQLDPVSFLQARLERLRPENEISEKYVRGKANVVVVPGTSGGPVGPQTPLVCALISVHTCCLHLRF
jgi:hypothetical protein